MTRKKFVKQLMALGYPRNNAEALAIYARCGGWTYEQYLEVERKCNGQLTALQTAAGRIAAKFAEGLRQLAPAVQKIADRVREAFVGIDLANGPNKTGFVLPLTTSNRDGLVAAWSAVDEVSQWPKENPHLPHNIEAQYEAFQRLTVEPIRAQLRQERAAQGGGGHD